MKRFGSDMGSGAQPRPCSRYRVCIARRTTVRVDEELLTRGKRALGVRSSRAAVEEALRRIVDQSEGERARRAVGQLRYLEQLPARVDLDVLAGDQMWR